MEFDRQRFTDSLQQVKQHFKDIDIGQDLTLWQGQLHVFETLPSTNRTLWQFLEDGAPPETAVLALQQESGRGQWGRQWQSPPGGLYLSVALAPDLQIEDSAQLTLCSAWGLATLLRSYEVPVLLKWPNDLVLQGFKLGGILTETRIQQGRIAKAVVGVGINWQNPVPDSGITLQSVLAQQPHPLIDSLEMLSAIALQGIMFGYHQWQQEGVVRLLTDYLKLLDSLGRVVTVGDRSGKVIGIAPTGELHVRLQSTTALPASDLEADADSVAEIYLKPGTISLGYQPLP